ncbi:MAG: hypothetical protein E5W01_05570 [Mesorhizobium sp.]|nr:MAG: hypothetical protein E5W01_05570 [Mesorhizobium sp.]
MGDFGRAYRIHGLFNCINDPAAFIGTTKRWIEEVDLREVSIVDELSNDVKESVAAVALDGAYAKMQSALRALSAAEAAPRSPDAELGKLTAQLRSYTR